MAAQIFTRAEPSTMPSATAPQRTTGPSTSDTLTLSAITVEHILASIIRLEAKIDGKDTTPPNIPQPQKPRPGPPYMPPIPPYTWPPGVQPPGAQQNMATNATSTSHGPLPGTAAAQQVAALSAASPPYVPGSRPSLPVNHHHLLSAYILVGPSTQSPHNSHVTHPVTQNPTQNPNFYQNPNPTQNPNQQLTSYSNPATYLNP